MGGQFPERVALGLTSEMLGELRKEAQRHGRTVLGQIRFFCEEGLRLSKAADQFDARLATIEQRLRIAEESVPYGQEAVKRGKKKLAAG